MSHSAIIAVESSDKDQQNPVYDVYASKDGGEKFSLYDHIKDNIHRGDNVVQTLNNRSSPDGKTIPDINNRPMEKNIAFGKLMTRSIDYLLYDVLYLIDRFNDINVYYLTWSAPLIQKIIADNLQIEVYPSTIKRPEEIKRTKPDHILEGKAFIDPSKSEQVKRDPTIDAHQINKVLEKSHTAIAKQLVSMHKNQNKNSGWRVVSIATLKLNKIHENVSVQSMLSMLKTGIGIHIPIENYENKEDFWYELRKAVKRIRWETAQTNSRKVMENRQTKEKAIQEHNRLFRQIHSDEFDDIIMSKNIKLA